MYPYRIEIEMTATSFAEAMAIADRIDGEGDDGSWRVVVREIGESPVPGNAPFCEGCEGHMFAGIRWPTSTNGDDSHEWVERCDTCERYESDEAARDWLIENYGPDTVAAEFKIGEAIPVGSTAPSPYFDAVTDPPTKAEATREAWNTYPEGTWDPEP